jgi:arylsulfatase
VTSNTYYDWVMHNDFFIFAAQHGAAAVRGHVQGLPPIQRPGSFTIDDAVEKMANAGAGAS